MRHTAYRGTSRKSIPWTAFQLKRRLAEMNGDSYPICWMHLYMGEDGAQPLLPYHTRIGANGCPRPGMWVRLGKWNVT